MRLYYDTRPIFQNTPGIFFYFFEKNFFADLPGEHFFFVQNPVQVR